MPDLQALFMIHQILQRSVSCNCRGVVPGCAGGAMAPPDFGRSVNPISTRGTNYAHLITTDTPGFSDLSTISVKMKLKILNP